MVSTDVPPAEIDEGAKALVMMSGTNTPRTAAGTITMPTPELRSTPPCSMSRAEARSAVFTCAGVAAGLADLINAGMAGAGGPAAGGPENGVEAGGAVGPTAVP